MAGACRWALRTGLFRTGRLRRYQLELVRVESSGNSAQGIIGGLGAVWLGNDSCRNVSREPNEIEAYKHARKESQEHWNAIEIMKSKQRRPNECVSGNPADDGGY
jgi:hypothetical protein